MEVMTLGLLRADRGKSPVAPLRQRRVDRHQPIRLENARLGEIAGVERLEAEVGLKRRNGRLRKRIIARHDHHGAMTEPRIVLHHLGADLDERFDKRGAQRPGRALREIPGQDQYDYLAKRGGV